ncbi:MAG: dTDP-4-dehydrorhamnose 3,5-epimerase [Pseudomonadota bacterium]
MIEPLKIPDVLLIKQPVHGDHRGFFTESYSHRTFTEKGLDAVFVQDNHSLSRQPYVVRGLHYQSPPHAQGKLVRAVKGAIFDVALDIRKGSPTFGQHVTRKLSAENHEQLWVPPGFAHGFCTLEPDTEVIYKVTDYYAPECDHGVMWNDPALSIDWPIEQASAVLSPKDQALPKFADVDSPFTLKG